MSRTSKKKTAMLPRCLGSIFCPECVAHIPPSPTPITHADAHELTTKTGGSSLGELASFLTILSRSVGAGTTTTVVHGQLVTALDKPTHASMEPVTT